jgi:hypothetical protein
LGADQRHVEDVLDRRQALPHRLELEESETRDELRQIENERLDAMMRKWLPRQDSKDAAERARAAAVLLRVHERRAKLNGLDAPTRVNVNHSGSIAHELDVDPAEVRAGARVVHDRVRRGRRDAG